MLILNNTIIKIISNVFKFCLSLLNFKKAITFTDWGHFNLLKIIWNW